MTSKKLPNLNRKKLTMSYMCEVCSTSESEPHEQLITLFPIQCIWLPGNLVAMETFLYIYIYKVN